MILFYKMVWIPYQRSTREFVEIKHFKGIPRKIGMAASKKTSESKGHVSSTINFDALQATLENAVKKNTPNKEKFGIAFSGGLDSGTIAFLAGKISKNAVLLCVGFPGSSDLKRVRPLAKKMKMKLVVHELNEKEMIENYAHAKKILKTDDKLQCTLGAVNLTIAKLAHDEKLTHVFVGSGADELFCGYGAFDKCRGDSDACEKLRTEKMTNVHEHDVKREIRCANEYEITLHAPYLDETFAALALKVPALENLQGKYGHVRKNTLRVLAEKMGVLKEIVHAPKKAMQYGSGTQKAIKRSIR